jgi:RNA polymerase sigma-70 factor (ECF subfamily)
MKRALQEKILLYRVRVKKDPEAFGRIYDFYAPRIYRFVFFKVSSEEEAQDITADVFLRAWHYLLEDTGRDVKHLGALLYSIARNRVIDLYRTRSLRETLPLTEETEETIPDDRRLMEKAEAEIDAGLLEKHLRRLKDEYREALILKYLDEMGAGEIAKVLDKTPGNVRVLLHRALTALREVIEAEAVKNDHDHVEQENRGTIEDAQNDSSGR